MSRAASGRAAAQPKSERSIEPGTYWSRSESPLASLMLVTPMLAIYEIGTRVYGQETIVAFSLLQRFIAQFGVQPSLFLPISLVVTLAAIHLAQRRPTRVLATDLLGMVIESVILAIPLLLLWYAASPLLQRWMVCSNPEINAAFPCLGAGIYEEFLFRLVLLNLLSFILGDVLELNGRIISLLMVLISASCFSVYHYLGNEHFSFVTFIFRTMAGVYFATIYLCRGFGITCGSHSSYDIIVVSLQSIH